MRHGEHVTIDHNLSLSLSLVVPSPLVEQKCSGPWLGWSGGLQVGWWEGWCNFSQVGKREALGGGVRRPARRNSAGGGCHVGIFFPRVAIVGVGLSVVRCNTDL